MKLTVQLGEHAHEVEITQTSERRLFSVDGKSLEAEAVELAPGIFSVLVNGRSVEVRIATAGKQLRVLAGAHEWNAEIRDPRKYGRGRAGALEAEGRQQVTAPMPGKVLRVLVAAGDAVNAGQGLVVVEAMKMQNEVRSPKSGTVERVMAKEGQAVGAGDALLIIA